MFPNDESCKDEQCMQRFTEQVQKHVNTAHTKNNILSEKTAKRIHEASNCKLHEVQERIDKAQCQRFYSHIESWISNMSRRKHARRNAFLQRIKN